MRFLAIFVALLAAPAGAAGLPPSPIVQASLVAAESGVTPGKKLEVGVILDPKEGWHTYWENPGDAGMPTTLEWALPDGFTAGNIDWPVPQRIAESALITFSY